MILEKAAKEKIVFCILSGGKSSRFKQDKRLATIEGKRLIDFPYNLSKKYTDKVYFSLRHQDNIEVDGIKIHDEQTFGGPACGIYNVMKNVAADFYVFLAGDMPFVNSTMIEEMINTARNGYDVVIFTAKDLWSPLPILLSKNVKNFFEKQSCENRSIKDIMRNFKTKKIEWNNPLNFFNVNTQQDLQTALALFYGADTDFDKFFIYEKSINIFIDDKRTTLNVTPIHLEEFIYGYTFTLYNRIPSTMQVSANEVKVQTKEALPAQNYTNSIADKIDKETVEYSMKVLQKKMYLHNNVGGYHATGIFNEKGELLALYEDVSIYATIDKCIGFALINNIPLQQHFLITTGRITHTAIKKCLRSGIFMIASRSNISKDSFILAKQNNIKIFTYINRNNPNQIFT